MYSHYYTLDYLVDGQFQTKYSEAEPSAKTGENMRKKKQTTQYTCIW